MAKRDPVQIQLEKLAHRVDTLEGTVEKQRRVIAAQKTVIADQEAVISDQRAIIARQEKRVGALERKLAKAKKDSSTSSKPPSSDIVKPPKGPKGSSPERRRKPGGQPGHPQHKRTPFPPEQIDDSHRYELSHCPDCGESLSAAKVDPRVVQQIELEKHPTRVDQHEAHGGWCPCCEKVHFAPLPKAVKTGQLVGPELTALVAYLKGSCHASFSTIRKYLRDVMGVTLSRGHLRKLVGKVSDALEASHQELVAALRSASVLNVDETGHKENGKRLWTWCFRAEDFTVFRIAESRGSDVLFDVLGAEFDGVIGCDYFSAYRKYMKDADVLVQFCFAHLIRDVRFLTTLRSGRAAAYGKRVLDAIREMFSVIHNQHALGPRGLKRVLNETREKIIAEATSHVPEAKEARNLAARFKKHGDAYFQFITTPGLEPTNNLAEQAIRFVVLDRVVTQGTRSAKGREWCERIWTVIATCIAQGRSAYEFIRESTKAHFRGECGPSLLRAPP